MKSTRAKKIYMQPLSCLLFVLILLAASSVVMASSRLLRMRKSSHQKTRDFISNLDMELQIYGVIHRCIAEYHFSRDFNEYSECLMSPKLDKVQILRGWLMKFPLESIDEIYFTSQNFSNVVKPLWECRDRGEYVVLSDSLLASLAPTPADALAADFSDPHDIYYIKYFKITTIYFLKLRQYVINNVLFHQPGQSLKILSRNYSKYISNIKFDEIYRDVFINLEDGDFFDLEKILRNYDAKQSSLSSGKRKQVEWEVEEATGEEISEVKDNKMRRTDDYEYKMKSLVKRKRPEFELNEIDAELSEIICGNINQDRENEHHYGEYEIYNAIETTQVMVNITENRGIIADVTKKTSDLVEEAAKVAADTVNLTPNIINQSDTLAAALDLLAQIVNVDDPDLDENILFLKKRKYLESEWDGNVESKWRRLDDKN